MIRHAVTVAALLCALAATVGLEEHRLERERLRSAEAFLTATNLVAERDSTRDVAATNARVARLLGDSLRLVERQVIQRDLHLDALDGALAAGAVRGRYALDVALDSLKRVVPAALDVSRGATWAAHFDLRHPPYTIAADVEMPEPPDSARIALRVALDPIPLEARLTCSTPNASGVRTASIAASSPPWATVRFDRVEQSPAVCGFPPPAKQSRRRIAFTPLVIGGGYVWPVESRARWGVFIGSGIALRL
jgi:hypothetical protein